MLEAVTADLQRFVGGKLQDIRQPNGTDVIFSIYAGGEAMFLVSCHPIFFRAHFVTRRPGNQPSPPQFLSALRAKLNGTRLLAAGQYSGERLLTLTFDNGCRVVAELMGKHSNLMLLDEHGKVVGAAKWVGRSKSSRPIQPNVKYELPPVIKPGPLRRSKFYLELEASGASMAGGPILAPGHGAYPVSVASLGWTEHHRESISVALEQHYTQEVPRMEADSLRNSILGQLDRVILARESAIADLRQAEEAGGKAPFWQRQAELILAYGPSVAEGASVLQAWDYDGTEMTIKLDATLHYKENATAIFDKAKRAKGRMGQVRDQIQRLSSDLTLVQTLRTKVEAIERVDQMRELQEEARQRRWLTEQKSSGKAKEDRPFEGHRIRELLGPGGFTFIYGETAEANDYVTTRVAKPNDWWLHVRGGTSAHVVILTGNQPEKVQRDALEFAAKLAVQHSPSKHAGYVPVDYTLKKYVRKPKGGPKGTAVYTHEKTIHVDS